MPHTVGTLGITVKRKSKCSQGAELYVVNLLGYIRIIRMFAEKS